MYSLNPLQDGEKSGNNTHHNLNNYILNQHNYSNIKLEVEEDLFLYLVCLEWQVQLYMRKGNNQLECVSI